MSAVVVRAELSGASPLGTIVPSAVMIPWEFLNESRFNPRRSDHDHADANLSQSIVALGVLQPLIVRQHPELPCHYEVVAGNRRLRAVRSAIADARLAPDFELPCLVRTLSDHDMRLIGLAENLARAELTPFEQGDEIAYLVDPRDETGRRIPRRCAADPTTGRRHWRHDLTPGKAPPQPGSWCRSRNARGV